MTLYLVTGGAGFIGSHLVRGLLDRGDSVRVLDDFSSGKRENLEGLGEGLEIQEGDLRDLDAVKEAARGAGGIFHLGARPSVVRSVEDPLTCWNVNLMGTVHVIEAAREQGAKVVFAGSSSAYGDIPGIPKKEDAPLKPLSPYAASKVAGEFALRAACEVHGLNAVVLRFFNVFGPRQVPDSPYSGVIAKFTGLLLAGERPVIDGDGSQSRDFTYVANVVDGCLRAMDRDVPPGEVINLACGDRITVLELFRTLREALGARVEPRFGPPRPGDVPHSQADITKARRFLGFEPVVPFRRGIEKTLAWYKENLR